MSLDSDVASAAASAAHGEGHMEVPPAEWVKVVFDVEASFEARHVAYLKGVIWSTNQGELEGLRSVRAIFVGLRAGTGNRGGMAWDDIVDTLDKMITSSAAGATRPAVEAEAANVVMSHAFGETS